MKLQHLTFNQWEANHDPDHEDKWCRELYPFHVFRYIDFDENKIGNEQIIDFNWILYYATIQKIELQEHGTYRATFDFSTYPLSKSQSWKRRNWNLTFQIIYSQQFDFITVFTKKKDPSKEYVVKFMNGDFEKISEKRSLPISELLFRTLLLHISEENYPEGQHYKLFTLDVNGIRELPEHTQFKSTRLKFAPFYSVDRDLWICYAFTEEKAHRIAFYNANQCKSMIVVFCNPTFTRHHRCQYENTKILSLYEYTSLLSKEVRIKYEKQIRFLQNHLRNLQQLDDKKLLEEIKNPLKEQYEIMKSDLMEALSVLKIIPQDDLGFFHSLASVNLINAFLSQKRKLKLLTAKEANLFRNMYHFKSYLGDILTRRIEDKNFSAPIYIQGDFVIVEMLNFQFSFHSVPKNSTLNTYETSSHNKEIIWRGKKLQPIAPLILYYSRALRQ